VAVVGSERHHPLPAPDRRVQEPDRLEEVAVLGSDRVPFSGLFIEQQGSALIDELVVHEQQVVRAEPLATHDLFDHARLERDPRGRPERGERLGTAPNP
jgi:hypothetical protein